MNATPSNIEKAQEIIKHDDSDQSAREKIHTHKAQLQVDLELVDDGIKLASQVIAQQDAIQLEISRLDRQEAVYQKRVKSRLASLIDVLKRVREDHRDAGFKFRDVCNKMADDAVKEKEADIEEFKDLVLAVIWLRDTSPRTFIEAMQGLLGKKGYFEHKETVEAAKKLGLFQEEPELPSEMKQVESILSRELGDAWEMQGSRCLESQLEQMTGISTDEPDEYDIAETTQHLGFMDRRSL